MRRRAGGGAAVSDELRTLEETAEQLRVSVRTVQRLRSTGQLRAVQIGRRTLFRQREIDAYVAAAYRRGA